MKKILFLILTLGLNSLLFSQQNKEVDIIVESSKAEFHGKTKEVREMIFNANIDPLRAKDKFRRNKQVPDNFKDRRFQSRSILPELEHQGADPLRQISPTTLIVEPKVNIMGIGNFGSPHDPTGDVGLDYYVQAVNVTYVGVYTKEGVLVQSFPMGQLWSGMGVFSAGDPIVLFDEIENRWIITEFTGPSNLLIAVSESSDPLGAYYTYSYSTPRFPDYPKYAIWGDKLLVTTNEQGSARLHQYFFDKNGLIAGEENVPMQRIEITGSNSTIAGFYVATPVDADGQLYPSDANPITMRLNDSSWGDVGQDQLEMYRFNVNFNDPDSTSVENISLPISPFDGYPCSAQTGGFACVPQPNGGGLDAIPELIMNIPKYRNFATHESIVLTFITDVTNGENLSGIRWMELRKEAGTDWTVFQEGTFAPDDDLNRFMPSIAIDGRGNIGLAYNISNEETYVGVRFTGRLVNDPPGMMSVQEYNVVDGLNTIFSGGRFGDYAQMGVDPVDESTFWYTTEYAGNGNNVTRTRIVAFELRKDSSDLSVNKLISPATSVSLSDNEQVSVEIQNTGINAISNFNIAYDLNGMTIEDSLITGELMPDSTLLFTFDTPVDLSEKKAYPFTISVSHPKDFRVLNDTLQKEVYHIYHRDAAIDMTVGETNCRSILETEIEIVNNGADTITEIDFLISINGVVKDSVKWEGQLTFLKDTKFPINIELQDIGENEIAVLAHLINGENDEVPNNNIVYFDINYESTNETLVLHLTTDEFPEETTWEILDTAQEVVFSGGPYDEGKTTIIEYLCLDKNSCYTYIIKDSAGDGICCGSGIGRYVMKLETGETLFQSFGSFGFEKSHKFCGSGYVCDLQVSIEHVEDSGAGDGTILINALNGLEPYLFSIDGGENFQDTPLFENLTNGEYEIWVEDNSGDCTYTETYSLPLSTNTNALDESKDRIIIKPNPNDGYFEFEYYQNSARDNYVTVEILDDQGRIIRSSRFNKYGDVFRGTISLLDHPSGNYILRFVGQQHRSIAKVIKY